MYIYIYIYGIWSAIKRLAPKHPPGWLTGAGTYCSHFSIRARHPCAGAMLIFSVSSFQSLTNDPRRESTSTGVYLTGSEAGAKLRKARDRSDIALGVAAARDRALRIFARASAAFGGKPSARQKHVASRLSGRIGSPRPFGEVCLPAGRRRLKGRMSEVWLENLKGACLKSSTRPSLTRP